MSDEWLSRLNSAMRRAKAKGVTQTEIAQKIGIKQPTLANWLAGRKEPSLAMIDRVSVALDITTIWLLHGEGVVQLNSAQYEKLKMFLTLGAELTPQITIDNQLISQEDTNKEKKQYAKMY